MRYIDLRSDTVTMPTQAMRDAMYSAEVGDDVFSDDPTVNEMEELAARILGKEDALLVTSGTQGNIVSIMAHTRRGDAIILGRGCHIDAHEAGSYAMLAGVSAVFAEDHNGIMRSESVRDLIRDDSGLQEARTGLVCVENAHSNGNVVPIDVIARIYDAARESGIPVHLDGARLFNAAVYLNTDVKELTKHCDSVMCCMSKGLCAPVGSVVAGSREFVGRARKIRKALGGGMRQAGFIAAAGKLALTDMTKRLRDDHNNARYLAEKLLELPGICLDLDSVKINMVYFKTYWDKEIVSGLPAKLLIKGIKILPQYCGEFRFVTNHGVTQEDCDKVIYELTEILEYKRHDVQ